MSKELFLKPKLCGKRFDNHSIPLEFLKDLAALEELLIEVAKSKYLKNYIDRKLVPRGFFDGVRLSLTGIENGSAMPVIELEIVDNVLFEPNCKQYLIESRDSTIEAIDAAGKGEDPTEYISENAISCFEHFGRGLRDDESIRFPRILGGKDVAFTKEIRKNLIFARERAKGYDAQIVRRGVVSELDQKKGTFEFRPIGHRSRAIKGAFSGSHGEMLIEGLRGYPDGLLVLIHGIGRLDKYEKLTKIESVDRVELLDPLDIGARLEDLSLLRDGWLDGGGKAPSKEGLNWLEHAFSSNYPEALINPHLYPTEEGGVQAEWALKKHSDSLEIDLHSHIAFWHSLELDSKQDQDKKLDLNDGESWQWLVSSVWNHGGVADGQ